MEINAIDERLHPRSRAAADGLFRDEATGFSLRMNVPLRILLVEDSPTDALMIEHALQGSGLKSTITRVKSESEIRAELRRHPDLVLSDYALPGFTAFDVLDWHRQSGTDAPFILVSGTIDTGTAVTTMRKGASDYILKGNIAGLSVAIHRAIEARNLRRATIQAEEKVIFLARMLNFTHDAIIVCDFEHSRIQYWNAGAQKLYGWTADEVMGESVDQVIQVSDAETCTMIKSLLRSGEWSTETYRKLRDGREIAVNERATLARNSEGQPTAILFFHYDITDRKLAEEQIRFQESLLRETGEVAKTMEAQFLRAQRLESVGTLASGIAHDLNNILSPIVLAGPLLEGELSSEVRRTIVQTINTSARRGVEIVRQVLMFARGMKGQRLPINCEQLIGEIATIVGEIFPKSITVTRKSRPGLWAALGDSTQLQQILLNLAINARDAMPNGGTLRISACNYVVDDSIASMTPEAKAGRHVLLQVADTGTGIAKTIIGKIFDPFFSTKEVGKGSGLGLSTVLGIVKSHGGFVTVESGPGRGTTFKVFIPAASPETDPDFVEEEIADPGGNDELILLVDDEVSIRTVAEVILHEAGYRVLLAADGTEAVARYAERRGEIRLMIADAVMPYLDGAALVRALRNLEPGLKVIGTSGYSDDPRASALKAAGIESFLTKPYDKHALLTTLHEVLHEVKS